MGANPENPVRVEMQRTRIIRGNLLVELNNGKTRIRDSSKPLLTFKASRVGLSTLN